MDPQEELYEITEKIRKEKKITLKSIAEHLSKVSSHYNSATFGYYPDQFRNLWKDDSHGGHALFGEYLKMLTLSPEEKEKVTGLIKKIAPDFGNPDFLSKDREALRNRLKFLPDNELALIGEAINQSYVKPYKEFSPEKD